MPLHPAQLDRRRDGATVVVVGSPNEAPLAAEICTRAPGTRDLTGSDLRNAILVLGSANVAISNDSGLLHVAAALGTPTIGIFGPTSPWHWAPLNPLAAVDPASPQSWNRYAYVNNNPLAMIDPFGDDGCYAWMETCTINGTPGVGTSGGGPSGLLNQGGGNYQLNWKTQRLWQGSCANILVTFDSGLVVTPATIGFQFN